MNESVRFGSIDGIRVGANWSVLLIAGLLAFGLATGALPEMAPGYPAAAYWAVAVGAALVFFVSLVAHEMAHAVVARRAGLPVEGITLWALGGVSRLGGDAPTARVELRMAIAGPATSLAIGLVAGIVAAALDGLHAPELLAAAMAWLAVINAVLGVFNLVPAFPLDGGRVLRAVLWGRSDDRIAATRTAGSVGRMVGFGLVGAGALLFMFVDTFQGIWFALLGWFVVSLGRAEVEQVEEQQLLKGVRIAEVMSVAPTCVPPDLTVQELLDRYVLRYRWSSYPVVDPQGRPLGVLTLSGVRSVSPERRNATPVMAVATPADRVPQLDASDALLDVLPALATSPVGRSLVVHDGRVIGLVSHSDVVACLRRKHLAGPGAGPGTATAA